jgi:hypothetical protein
MRQIKGDNRLVVHMQKLFMVYLELWQ